MDEEKRDLALGMAIALLAAAPVALLFDIIMPGSLTASRATLIAAVTALPLSFASLVIAYHVYQLQAREKANDWRRGFRELHEKFWSDDKDFATVRRWIACDSAYDQVKPILRKRLNNEGLSPEEYDAIEKIDRFCAIMLRVKQVNASAPELDDLTSWEIKSYYTWWLGRMVTEESRMPKEDRKEFWGYIETCWDRLQTP